jgi:hypothetical protein
MRRSALLAHPLVALGAALLVVVLLGIVSQALLRARALAQHGVPPTSDVPRVPEDRHDRIHAELRLRLDQLVATQAAMATTLNLIHLQLVGIRCLMAGPGTLECGRAADPLSPEH